MFSIRVPLSQPWKDVPFLHLSTGDFVSPPPSGFYPFNTITPTVGISPRTVFIFPARFHPQTLGALESHDSASAHSPDASRRGPPNLIFPNNLPCGFCAFGETCAFIFLLFFSPSIFDATSSVLHHV